MIFAISPGAAAGVDERDVGARLQRDQGLGAKNSEKRTPEQAEVARFWTAVGVATWNPIVRSLATAHPRSLVENARLLRRKHGGG